MRSSKQILPTVVYLAGIVIAYLAPVNTHGELNRSSVLGIRSDYLLHALLFFPLPLLLASFNRKKNVRVPGLFLIAVSLAALAECIHLLVPYRSFNPIDMLANISGACIGGITMTGYTLFRRKRLGKKYE
jgi:VanZ family protein